MRYTYITQGTCAREISFDVCRGKITNVQFTGGCSGNLKALPVLLEGWTAVRIARKLRGITCGGKNTSCADQLARAVLEATGKKI